MFEFSKILLDFDSIYKSGGEFLDAIDVAQYCLWYCEQQDRAISNLQLQKILYYIQAAFLVENKKPCFNENIVAWQYGPVVKEVYSKYAYNSSNKFKEVKKIELAISPEELHLINRVCRAKSKYSAGGLVNATHKESPWKTTSQGEIIHVDAIGNYFKDHESKLYE